MTTVLLSRRLSRVAVGAGVYAWWLVLAIGTFRTLKADDAVPESKPPVAERVPHTHQRAGNPQEISPWANFGRTHRYGMGYVGGGAAGKHRYVRYHGEGTWGWDYINLLYPRRTFLGWSHGLRYQGGSGQYSPERPARPFRPPQHLGNE